MRHSSLAGVLVGASMLAAPATAQIPNGCRPVMDPAQRRVQGTTLIMDTASYTVGTTRYTTNVYNRQFVAPTLTMNPGERFQLSVVNNMHATAFQPDTMISRTNYHTHGLVVTPRPDGGDNVTNVSIPNDGTRRPYDFLVPAYHTQGMFWYHPHPHELTGSQVAGGLSGALMVGSVLKYFPQYKGVPERTLLIRDMSFTFSSPTLWNVNGSTCAVFPMAAGGRQLWHIGNFAANHFVNLKLRDVGTGQNVQWILLALDGNQLATATPVDSIFLPPGSRAEAIVAGPAAGRLVQFYSDSIPADQQDPVSFGYLQGTTARARTLLAGPAPAGLDKAVVDTLRFLRNATAVGRQTFTYSFPKSGGAAVNDTVYSPGDPPVLVPVGQVQEWTIVNGTPFLHTFHIHQTDFEVVSVNGQPADEGRLRDNILIGTHKVRIPGTQRDTTVGDTVVVRMVFEPIAIGPFVFHCHVLQHEDEGMMHNVCVYDPLDPRGKERCNSYFGGAGQGHAGH